jgi:hypothetical protein
VAGGVLAWRAAALIGVPTMLPLLAAMNLVCFWGSLRSRDSQGRRTVAQPVASDDGRQGDGAVEWASPAKLSPLRTIGEAPYLRNLALIATLGAVTTGLLDYVFGAEAVDAYTEGPDLVAFFALFWLTVGVLSFGLPALLRRVAVEKLGLAATIALLPGVVVLGGVFGRDVSAGAGRRAGDTRLRGTALQYVETLLPDGICDPRLAPPRRGASDATGAPSGRDPRRSAERARGVEAGTREGLGV